LSSLLWSFVVLDSWAAQERRPVNMKGYTDDVAL
jgi:hypothetical protein